MIPDASMTVHKAEPIQLIEFFDNIVSTIEVITPTRRVASGVTAPRNDPGVPPVESRARSACHLKPTHYYASEIICWPLPPEQHNPFHPTNPTRPGITTH